MCWFIFDWHLCEIGIGAAEGTIRHAVIHTIEEVNYDGWESKCT